MPDTLRTHYRDLGERFQRSAEMAAQRGSSVEARRMYLSAAREYFRVAAASDVAIRETWMRKAERMEALSAQDMTPEIHRSESINRKSQPGTPTGKELLSGEAEQQQTGRAERAVTLEDVAGLEDVKSAIRTRIIYPFQHPETSRRFRKNPGGGILMFGPPGVGKTMIARAVAGTIGAGFYSVACSDIFSKYVGETEKNMRQVFEQAAACEKAVLFLDEVEALLGRRSGNERSPVLDRLVPEFLSLTDGVRGGDGNLLLLAATNRPWDLDEAALREGRFGQLIHVGLPDREARRFILRRHLSGIPLAEDLNPDAVADRMEGYSGADIAGLAREATDLPYLREIETGQPQALQPDDLEQALLTARMSVTPDMLDQFRRFAASRGVTL